VQPKTIEGNTTIFAYDELKLYLTAEAKSKGVALPQDFYLIDVKYLHFLRLLLFLLLLLVLLLLLLLALLPYLELSPPPSPAPPPPPHSFIL